MQQRAFKPKYPNDLYIGLLALILLEAFLLWLVVSGKDQSLLLILTTAFFGLLLAAMPYAFVKRIVFDTHFFVIEKYLWRTNIIEYADIIDIGATMIKTRHGILNFQLMLNADELRSILAGLIEQGKISRDQMENRVITREAVSGKALMPAGIISFVLWAFALFVLPNERLLFRDLGFLVFFVPSYLLVYWFLKSRAENQ